MVDGVFFVADGAALGLAAGFMPGPLLALVIEQSLRFGAREGVKVAFVPLLTDAPAVILSLMLLSSVSKFGPALGMASIAGAFVVLYLAYDSLRAAAPTADSQPVAPRSVMRGALVNMLSPHPFLFWLAVGAPVAVRAWHTHWAAAAAFIATLYVCLVGAKIVVAVTVGRSRSLLAGRGYVVLMRVIAAMLALFGCRLFWEGLHLLVSSQPS
jgi:threonine/homoserine/homoserine lactone efflux protein